MLKLFQGYFYIAHPPTPFTRTIGSTTLCPSKHSAQVVSVLLAQASVTDVLIVLLTVFVLTVI